MPGTPERRTHDYLPDHFRRLQRRRRHRYRLPALPESGNGIQEVLTKIDHEVPEHLKIHLIRDNCDTHKTPAIRAWLERHPRFHRHFAPAGSSWINQVERWFGFLADQKIRRGAHKSVSKPSKPTSVNGSRTETRTPPRSPGRRPQKRSSTPSPDSADESGSTNSTVLGLGFEASASSAGGGEAGA
jgi:DDE superfamily endonuclease